MRVDRRNVNILLSDILFVESQRDYLLIYTTDGKLMTKMTLSTFEQEVEGRGFVRIHRSYLIRARAVSSFTASEVDIGDQTLPIGRSHRESAASALAEQ